MKLFGSYIRQNFRGILIWTVFCIIFLASFILYHLPLEAVIYPALLCFIFGALLLFYDFYRVKKKHALLGQIHHMSDVISEILPKAERIEEEDYQEILRLLSEEQNIFQTETNRRYADMVDYYTVWAHQIKTPIASMRLNLQNEDSKLSRKLSGDLLRVEQYVEMVLTFLRLDFDNTDYVIKEYDLDGIVKQAVKKFAGEFISRKLSLNYEPFHTTVITDEKWLSFVIEQVLSNALKYTPSGSVTLILEPEKKLCIRDTGIGIAPSDLPRIFENGYTGYNGRTHKKASGIGLYLCKRICTNLGHSITADSTLDEGTTITIDLAQGKLEVE